MPAPALMRAIALDYDTMLGRRTDPPGLDPRAADTVRALHHDLGLDVMVCAKPRPGNTWQPDLHHAGITDLVTVAVDSLAAGRTTQSPFWDLLCDSIDCAPDRVMFNGGDLPTAAAAVQAGLRAALVRPDGLPPDESLPDGAHLITHLADLPDLLTGRQQDHV